jgi:hypothetical protein
MPGELIIAVDQRTVSPWVVVTAAPVHTEAHAKPTIEEAKPAQAYSAA